MPDIKEQDGFLCATYLDIDSDSEASALQWGDDTIIKPVELLQMEAPPFEEGLPEFPDALGPTAVPNMREHPFRSCGQIYMTMEQMRSRGSASLLRRPDIIITAAHCIYSLDKKKFVDDIDFYWQRKGNTARDAVPIQYVIIPTEYVHDQNTRYDFALCVLSRNVYCDKDDLLAFTTNMANYEATTIGYPIEAGKFNEDTMYYAQNKVDIRNINGMDFWHVPDSLAYAGASGGPWVFNTGTGAVSSFVVVGQKDLYASIINTQRFEHMYSIALEKAPTPIINRFKLKNDWGGFVAELHVNYEDKTYKDETDILINTEHETRLIGRMPEQSIVQLKAFVRFGKDRYSTQRFIFDSNVNKAAHFSISGGTLTTKLTYNGVS